MAYGLTIKDAAGNIIMSPDDRITRLIYHGVALPGATGSVNLPAISNKLTIQFAWSTPSIAGFGSGWIPVDVGHKVTRSGTTISWSPLAKRFNGIYIASEIIVFCYT